MDPFHHLNTSFSNPYHPLLSPSPPQHHHHFPPLPLAAETTPPLPSAASSSTNLDRERLPQWSHAETAAFLAIRADLDHSFLTTKRNKALWEAVSARLAARGFARTPDQCKSKWKNLVTRFKGTAEAADPSTPAAAALISSTTRQFPFHEEVRRIFDARTERARAILERNKGKGKDDEGDGGEGGGRENDDDDDDDDDLEPETMAAGEESAAVDVDADGRRRKKKRSRREKAPPRTADKQQTTGEVEAMLREFMRRQAEMEERWAEAAEAREAERRAREADWRAAMVALAEERLALARRWRDREDAWRARADEREERRHQLVAALLAKLGGGDAAS